MIFALLLAGHLIGIVGYTLLLRKAALGKVDNLLLTALMQTAVFIPSILFFATGNVSFDHTARQWLFLCLGGVMLTGLLAGRTWALAHLDASIYSIIFNLRLFTVTILGYLFLDELPPPLQIAGGLIILTSILMLNLHKNSLWRSKGILIGFFTMLWFSFHATLEKYNLLQLDFPSYFFIFALIGSILLWALVLVRRVNIKDQLIHIKSEKLSWLLITNALSGYCYVLALKYGSLAVVNYVSGMSVALIVLFGIYTLGEKTHIKQKLTAVGVACIGLTLILVSKVAQG